MPKAQLLMLSLAERLATNIELAQTVVKAFAMRASVCAEEDKGEVAALILEQACEFTGRIGPGTPVAGDLAIGIREAVDDLREKGYWSDAVRALLAAANLASFEPRDDRFVMNLGFAALSLVLNFSGQNYQEDVEDRFPDVERIFVAVRSIVLSSQFEEVVAREAGPDIAQSAKTIFEKLQEILNV